VDTKRSLVVLCLERGCSWHWNFDGRNSVWAWDGCPKRSYCEAGMSGNRTDRKCSLKVAFSARAFPRPSLL